MKRGDVILVRFPHPSGQRGKKRPALVVQSDAYASAVSTVVVAEVTKNLTMKGDPACLFIDVSTPDGRATGLLIDSVNGCKRIFPEPGINRTGGLHQTAMEGLPPALPGRRL